MPFNPNPGGTATHYDLVLIGKGYSIATYLLMADLTWVQRIAILGGPDAWSQQLRGDGIVNHARFLVDPRFRERLGVKQEAVDRKAFLGINKAVLEAAVGEPDGEGGLRNNTPVVWPDGKPAKTKTEFGSDGLDGSKNFLVVSVTPRIDTADAPIQRGIKYGDNANAAPALDLAKDDPLCVYDIDYKDYGKDGPSDLKSPTTITAMKVVFGGGAGPHRVPEFAAAFVGLDNKTVAYTKDGQVMDLDGFMRRFGEVGKESKELDGKVAAIVGPNAGVDAAVTALQKKATLKWLIAGRPGSKPAWLPTEHYDKDFPSLRDKAHKAIVNYQDNRPKKIGLTVTRKPDKDREGKDVYEIVLPNEQLDGRDYYSYGVSDQAEGAKLSRLDPSIFVRLTGSDLDISARFLVYAVGQDPTLTETIDGKITRIGPATVLKKPVLDSLVPVFDRNQRFGAASDTILGLETRMAWDGQKAAFVSNLVQASDLLNGAKVSYDIYGTDRYRGLEVVGAAAFALRDKAIPVEQFSMRAIAQLVANAMSNLPKALRQKALATADQLGTLRSAIEAATGADFRSQIDFMTGFQAAQANFREAAADTRQDCKDTQEQRKRAAALEQTAALVLMALTPEARAAYSEMYKDRRDDLVEAVEGAPKNGDDFLYAMTNADYWTTSCAWWAGRFLTSTTGIYVYGDVQRSAGEPGPWLDRITPTIAWLQQHAPADYNGLDETGLAVLIATSYPHILPNAWEQLSGKIIQQRSDAGAWGYGQNELTAISSWLAEVDRLSVPLTKALRENKNPDKNDVEELATFLQENPQPYRFGA